MNYRRIYTVLLLATLAPAHLPAQIHNLGDENFPSPIRTQYKFATRDWIAMTAALHTGNPPAQKTINAFITKMMLGEPDLAVPSAHDLNVQSAAFFPVAGASADVLIALVNVMQTRFSNTLVVITRGASGPTIQTLDLSFDHDVHSVARDLDGTGKVELLYTYAWSDYQGANSCIADWTRIYSLQSGRLTDRSAAFPDYYRQHLQEITAEMPTTRATDKKFNRDETICLQMEADRIQRFLRTNPKAGEDRALAWIQGSNPWWRAKGIEVLADIADRRSIATIRSLLHDPDPEVSVTAESALEDLGEKPTTTKPPSEANSASTPTPSAPQEQIQRPAGQTITVQSKNHVPRYLGETEEEAERREQFPRVLAPDRLTIEPPGGPLPLRNAAKIRLRLSPGRLSGDIVVLQTSDGKDIGADPARILQDDGTSKCIEVTPLELGDLTLTVQAVYADNAIARKSIPVTVVPSAQNLLSFKLVGLGGTEIVLTAGDNSFDNWHLRPLVAYRGLPALYLHNLMGITLSAEQDRESPVIRLDSDGTIHALREGIAYVTGDFAGVKDRIKVTVSSKADAPRGLTSNP